VNGIEERIRLK